MDEKITAQEVTMSTSPTKQEQKEKKPESIRPKRETGSK